MESIRRLSYSTEADDETTRFLNQIHEQAAWGRERRRLRWAVWLWFTTTLLFAGFSTWLTARQTFMSHFGSFETGYATDFSKSTSLDTPLVLALSLLSSLFVSVYHV